MTSIPDLVQAGLKNPVVNELYQTVLAQTPIDYVIETDGEWGSATRDAKTTIHVAPTERPAAALAHELLHAKLKIAGYRQHLVTVTLDKRPNLISSIAAALDNELQHHKMFAEFTQMGFPPGEFYYDDDHKTLKIIRRRLERMKRTNSPGDFLLCFLTVIASGGADTEKERQQLRVYFPLQCGNDHWGRMLEIEAIVEQWKTGTSLDPGPTIVSIYRALGDVGPTWIGTSQRFPDEGHFTGEAFTGLQALLNG